MPFPEILTLLHRVLIPLCPQNLWAHSMLQCSAAIRLSHRYRGNLALIPMTLCDPTAEPSVPTSITGSPGRAQQLPRAPTASCSKWRLLRQFYNWSPLSSWGDSAFLFNAAFIWLLFFFSFPLHFQGFIVWWVFFSPGCFCACSSSLWFGRRWEALSPGFPRCAVCPAAYL